MGRGLGRRKIMADRAAAAEAAPAKEQEAPSEQQQAEPKAAPPPAEVPPPKETPATGAAAPPPVVEEIPKGSKDVDTAVPQESKDVETAVPAPEDEEAGSPNHRQKFADRAAFGAALARQRGEARLLKITEEGALVPWREATPQRIGKASQSLGLQLYFMFLKSGCRFLFFWSLCLAPLLYVCSQPSPGDARLEVGGLAQYSLASFGDQDGTTTTTVAGGGTSSSTTAGRSTATSGGASSATASSTSTKSRTVTLLGTSYPMQHVAPILSALGALGAAAFFLFCWHFERTVVAKASMELDQAAVTPGDFTVQVDFLPMELFQFGQSVKPNQIAPSNAQTNTLEDIKVEITDAPEDRNANSEVLEKRDDDFFGGGEGVADDELRKSQSIVAGTGEGDTGGGIKSTGEEDKTETVFYSSSTAPTTKKSRMLPPDTNAFHQSNYLPELKRHFEDLLAAERQKRQLDGCFVPPSDLGPPAVADIAFARDWTGTLLRCKRQAELDKQIEELRRDGADAKKIAKLEKKLQKLFGETSTGGGDSGNDPTVANEATGRVQTDSNNNVDHLLGTATKPTSQAGRTSFSVVPDQRQKEGVHQMAAGEGEERINTDGLVKNASGVAAATTVKPEGPQPLVNAKDEPGAKPPSALAISRPSRGTSLANSGLRADPKARHVMRAFVTFELAYDKELAEDLYQKSRGHLWRLLFQSKEKNFYSHKLRIMPAPEPTNILWENQDLRFREFLLKKMAVGGLTVGILVLFGYAIMQGNIFAKDLSDKSSSDTCSDPVAIQSIPTATGEEPQALTFTPAVASEYLRNATTSTGSASGISPSFNSCQCDALGYGALISDSELRNECDGYFWDATVVVALTSVLSLAVVVVNAVLKTVLVALTAWERPATISLLERGVATKVFVAQFVNTALLILFLNARPLSDHSFASDALGTKGEYSDYSHEWYATVGAAVSLTLAINVLSPHGIDVVKSWVQRVKISCFAHCCAGNERDLKEYFEPPKYEYAARCGSVLNTLFATLLFAPGLPILIPFAMVNFFACYWSDKFLLLSFCRRPPQYDEKVVETMMSWIPYAFLVHSVMGVWMLGNDAVFQSDFVEYFSSRASKAKTSSSSASSNGKTTIIFAVPDFLGLNDVENVVESDLDYPTRFALRCIREGGFPYFCLLLIVLGYFAASLVMSSLRLGFAICCSPIADAIQENGGSSKGQLAREGFAEDETTYSEQKKLWREARMCPGYQLGDHPEWRELLKGVEWLSSSDRNANERRTAKISSASTTAKAQDEAETLDTFDLESFDDDADFYDDFYSSETTVDDE
ncbi:unnamed protein product [Amoebophrya sp. A25]|nr:unnamed protein product [Amoebophrya sp. A25]|eukprot:GSA25T00020146001.1